MKITCSVGEVPEAAKQLRQEVFVDEQGFSEEFDAMDRLATHFLLWDGDLAIATLRLFEDESGELHIGRMAVKKNYRDHGYGKALMKDVLHYAREKSYAGIVLSAQVQAQGFYEMLGFVCEGASYMEQDCPHVRMRLLF